RHLADARVTPAPAGDRAPGGRCRERRRSLTMGVVLCGRDLPAVAGSGAALAALDGAAIDRELGLGRDRVVMVNPSSPPEQGFGRLAQEVFGLPPVQVIMLVYPVVVPS